ncbi:MAG: hypothetical protein ABW173_09165 [Sphingomonas sp.]
MVQDRTQQAQFTDADDIVAPEKGALFEGPSGIPLDAFWAILDPEGDDERSV